MRRSILLIMLLAVSMGLYAAGEVTLKPQQVLPGQEVTVAVRVSFAEAPLSTEFTFQYDSAALDFVSLKRGSLTANALHAVHDRNGVVRAAFASAEPFPFQAGELCTLTFKVKQGPDHTTISLREMRVDDKPQSGKTLTLDLTKPLKHGTR